jgi:hypothetical protein
MTRYSIFTAASPMDVIMAAWGHDGDGVKRTDTQRAPDFGEFMLPKEERARDFAIVNMFTNWCLATDGQVLLAFDDNGRARAWRFSGSK